MNQDDKNQASAIGQFFSMAANGNRMAEHFLVKWHEYCHAVDDVIDEKRWSAEPLLRCFLLCHEICAHPFYRLHAGYLHPVVVSATNYYAIANDWEKSDEPWRRRWADVFRHAGVEMVTMVSVICGGWDHAGKVSRAFLSACYINHKDKHGEA